MSIEKKVKELRQEYNTYAQKVNVHQKSTQGVNSGAWGRDFESRVNSYLNNFRRKKIIAGNNQYDAIKKGLKIEVKSGQGELFRLDRDGNRYGLINKTDYIIYAPLPNPNIPVDKLAYVLPTPFFLNELYAKNLVQKKTTSATYKAFKSGLIDSIYPDRERIQFNSIKKENALWDILEEFGMTLPEFCEKNNIKNNNY